MSKAPHYTVELFLDRKAATLVRAIWYKIGEEGMGKSMFENTEGPHVTISGFADADPGEISRTLRAVSAASKPPPFSFESLGTFSTKEGVVFLAPVVNRPLLLLHDLLHRSLKGKVKRVHSFYSPAHWVPHCTIGAGLDREQVAEVVGMFSRKALPITGLFEKIGLVDTETGQLRCRYKFKG